MGYEIYKVTKGRGTILVLTNIKNIYTEGAKIAKRYFKCSEDHLILSWVWIKGEDLYFFSHPEGCHREWAYSYVSKSLEE